MLDQLRAWLWTMFQTVQMDLLPPTVLPVLMAFGLMALGLMLLPRR